jgi:hypothetical protein
MSYLKCPDCGREIKLFGDSKIDSIAEKNGLNVLARMPIDPSVAELCDKGDIEKLNHEYLSGVADYIERELPDKKEISSLKIAIPTEGSDVSSHFGKCGSFTIVEIRDSEVVGRRILDTSENQHGLLPGFLAAQGVSLVIAGGWETVHARDWLQTVLKSFQA